MPDKEEFKCEEVILDDDGLVSDFAYQLINDLFDIDSVFISNDSDLYTFSDEINGKVYDCECNDTSNPIDELCENCQILVDMYTKRVFKRIEKFYKISMKDFIDEHKIWRVADYVFKKLDEKENI